MHIDLDVVLGHAGELERGGHQILLLVLVEVHPARGARQLVCCGWGAVWAGLPWLEGAHGAIDVRVALLHLVLILVSELARSRERFVDEALEVVEGLVEEDVGHDVREFGEMALAVSEARRDDGSALRICFLLRRRCTKSVAFIPVPGYAAEISRKHATLRFHSSPFEKRTEIDARLYIWHGSVPPIPFFGKFGVLESSAALQSTLALFSYTPARPTPVLEISVRWVINSGWKTEFWQYQFVIPTRICNLLDHYHLASQHGRRLLLRAFLRLRAFG